MADNGVQSLTMPITLRVTQRDVTFYLASLRASELFQICAGLRQDAFRERLIDVVESDGGADEEARKFVNQSVLLP